MDPNDTLSALRESVKNVYDGPGLSGDYVFELAEQITALDEWLSGGGFLPDAWQHNELTDRENLAGCWLSFTPTRSSHVTQSTKLRESQHE